MSAWRRIHERRRYQSLHCTGPAEDDVVGEEPQITISNTGWSEEEMERMRAMGYDGMDIIRAWYS